MSLSDLPLPIQDFIVSEVDKEYPSRRINDLYITELLGCLRKAYLRRTIGEGKKDVDGSYALFRGGVYDRIFTPLFNKNQVRVSYRVPGLPIVISGKADFVDGDTVYELKTTKTLHYVMKRGAMKSHIDQVRFYAYNLALYNAKIIYMDFGGACVIDVPCNGEGVFMGEIERTAFTLYNALKTSEIPPCNAEKWECGYCDFKGNGCDGI